MTGQDMDMENATKLQGEALKRMRRGFERGTGCRLTPDMLRAMSISLIGEWWENLNEDGTSSL